ncbi:MAG: hypothetical protein QM811_00430 [Pirellulales bacterium]
MPSLAQIEALLAEDPTDVFLRYALAMELDKQGDHDASLTGLRTLAGENPPYIPAFFMAGQQLTRLGRLDEARAMLRDGITAADASGDAHAAREMREFLSGIGRLGE